MTFTSYEEYQKKKKDLLDILRSAAKEIGQLKKVGVNLNSNALEEQAALMALKMERVPLSMP